MRPHTPDRARRDTSRCIRWLRNALVLLTVSLFAGVCMGGLVTGAADASSAAQIAITADNPPPPATPSGQASTYTINFTCSAVVGSSCGANPTITIPLDLTSANPATPDDEHVVLQQLEHDLGPDRERQGGRRQLRDHAERVGAYTPAIRTRSTLSVTPPNNITPDGASWSLDTDRSRPPTSNR